MPQGKGKLTVYYDGSCPKCIRDVLMQGGCDRLLNRVKGLRV